MLDTSDGLAEASRLLAEASRVRVVIEEDALPLYPALDALPPSERWPAAFYGGDYELLATLPPTVLSRARTAVEKVGRRLTVIGRVDRGSGSWLESAGARHVMPPGGWQPFDAPHRRPK